MDMSPDHSQLLIESGGEVGLNNVLWTVPLPTGSPRRLGSIIADGIAGARWSARRAKSRVWQGGGSLDR